MSVTLTPEGGCGATIWMRRTKVGSLVVRGDEMGMRFGSPAEVWLVPLAQKQPA